MKTAEKSGAYASYTANALNQLVLRSQEPEGEVGYIQRTTLGSTDVIGSAETNVTVTVNNQGVNRQDNYPPMPRLRRTGWYKRLTVDNVLTSAYEQLNIVGVYSPGGTNEDIVSSVTGSVFVAETTFLYDSWNLVREQAHKQTNTQTNFFTWGLDLSGSLQGAGGIGGLLASYTSNSARLYTYDANGNVSELLDPDTGLILAHYEYSPFGKTIVATGELTKENPYRFSTKYTDDETKLVYYGYRFYSPDLGRWVSREPLGELASFNLFVFLWNGPLNYYDVLGLFGAGGADAPYPGHGDFSGSDCFDFNLEDEDPETSPFKDPERHFRDLEQSEKDVASAVASCSKEAFERAMHRGQDFFSHYNKGYRWKPFRCWKNLGFGHMFDGSKPDQDKNAWEAAEEWAKNRLEDWNKNCCKDISGNWVIRGKSICCEK